ncbi:hypothetical protein GCM10009560_68820 [Nonomuraea longicatena]|uniref:Uncharacterized protein n=1 Tax=Nonomuraea longicatena TaxID=83682 RepID=A0ABP4BGT2_9ACTN
MRDQRGRLRPAEPGFDVVAQVALDLPDALAGHGEALGEFVQCDPLRGVQAVAGDGPLPLVERAEQAVDDLGDRAFRPRRLLDRTGRRPREPLEHAGEQLLDDVLAQGLGGALALGGVGEAQQRQDVAEGEVPPEGDGEVGQVARDGLGAGERAGAVDRDRVPPGFRQSWLFRDRRDLAGRSPAQRGR